MGSLIEHARMQTLKKSCDGEWMENNLPALKGFLYRAHMQD